MGDKKKFIVVVIGPTASGKTGCAIEIAKAFKGEIISADSRQFYREMHIGTAKPTAEERAAAPHHLVNSLSIKDPYTAGDFERDALGLVDEIYLRGNLPIICGGSGLYIKALLEGLDGTSVPQAIRKDVQALYADQGLIGLQAELQSLDPEYYKTVDQNNHVRLMRGIEILRNSGRLMKDMLHGIPKQRDFNAIKLGLEMEREVLYKRINERVEVMMQSGLEAEARALHPYKNLQALQTVGYKELFAYFEGSQSLEEAVASIKQNSRRYAKRQMTWLRKEEGIAWFRPDHTEAIKRHIALKMGDCLAD